MQVFFMKLKDLEYFKSGYPRAFFFRPSEHFASSSKVSFEEWERIFIHLSGIMGKVTKDEIYKVPYRVVFDPPIQEDQLKDQAKEYFVRFKKRHPEQLVLLHYNGDDRDTDDNINQFFGGHWIYFEGCHITQDLPADEAVTEIHVEDSSLFHVNTGWGPKGIRDPGKGKRN
jgi:hypothetical protein